MQIETVTGHIAEQETQAIVISLFEKDASLSASAEAVDVALGGRITAVWEAGDFKGKRNDVLVLYPGDSLPTQRVLLVGLGAKAKFTPDVARQAAASAAQKAHKLGVTHLTTVLHGAGDAGEITSTQAAEAVVEGTLLGLYDFKELKTSKEQPPEIKTLTLVGDKAQDAEALANAARQGQIIAEATLVARDLVNRPANIATPTHLAETARQIAEEVGLSYQLLDKAALEELGAHALLSVNQGGNEPARMVILEHNRGTALPTVVLAGKGITFDTGGISLKRSTNMHHMKSDMGGAAAVIGAMRAVALLELPLHVVGLAPLTENMPAALATKPGDVIGSLKGVTIEVINTDAEGRLILADALAYAERFKPQALFDIATLTGGRTVALGAHAAAVMGDEALIARLRAAGEATGERVWPLPLFEEYAEAIKSDVADIKNVGGRAASTITGGMFLKKFVPEDIPWVHIDIAGLALTEKKRPYVPKGGTGFGVRLFVEMLRRWNAGQNDD